MCDTAKSLALVAVKSAACGSVPSKPTHCITEWISARALVPIAGVMGGVTSMNGFLQSYFPSVLERQNSVNTVGNLYCQYDSQTLQLMTSVLFISGAICELTGTTGMQPVQYWRTMCYAAIFMPEHMLCAS